MSSIYNNRLMAVRQRWRHSETPWWSDPETPRGNHSETPRGSDPGTPRGSHSSQVIPSTTIGWWLWERGEGIQRHSEEATQRHPEEASQRHPEETTQRHPEEATQRCPEEATPLMSSTYNNRLMAVRERWRHSQTPRWNLWSQIQPTIGNLEYQGVNGGSKSPSSFAYCMFKPFEIAKMMFSKF